MSEKVLEFDIIPAEWIRQARMDAAGQGRRLLLVLEEHIGQPPEDFLQLLGRTTHYPTLTIQELQAFTPDFATLPYAEACQKECIALRHEDRLVIAFADPFNDHLLAWLDERLTMPFSLHLMHHADLAAYLVRHEESMRAMDQVSLQPANQDNDGQLLANDLSLASITADASPVIKLVNSTLYDALKANASDIHLETTASGLTIKYRIDGALTTISSVPGLELAEQALSRIKIMAELDIAERRIPQDGRFKVSVRGREVDFRVSIMPSIFGEDGVLRILDKQSLSDQMHGLRLENLGFAASAIAQIRRFAAEPYGMVLVTGPTGSGKTTTLYAAMSEINHGLDKIITIEDPVEYQLPGILQIPVNEKKGLTFARGLRSILRHDPDKIMVGEIRDPETAQIAVQSALTGHLVFTTVHANNVFDVIGRFMHMGVDPYSFVSALNGIIAQRLVRVSCPQCTEPFTPSSSLLAESKIDTTTLDDYRFMKGAGCGQCRGTGYKGRKAIAEWLHLNDEIREQIVSKEPIRRIKETARANGTRFLREAALELVKSGETTLQEVNRVTSIS